jgi:hypothetical protein
MSKKINNNINQLKKLVIHHLKEFPKTRDDVFYLIKMLHDWQMEHYNIPQSKYYDYLFGEKLFSTKTIDRTWRKALADHPELRGKNWQKRQIQAGLMALKLVNKNMNQNQLSFQLK